MRRFQIPHNVIRNPKISHNAIYLYMILKTMTASQTVNAYSTSILEKAQWKDRRTLKKYLEELKKLELVSYPYNNFPINKTLTIKIISIPNGEYFTQVDEFTIQKIIDLSTNTKVETDINQLNHTKKTLDLKEMAIRLFYYYESYYNKEFKIAFPSYRTINLETKISNIYIKSLNYLFNINGLVIVNQGKKKNNNERGNNTYIPVCNRKENKIQNKQNKKESDGENIESE